MLSVGQEVEAKIVDFNKNDHKISLSMKALQDNGSDDDADVVSVDVDQVISEEGEE